MYVCCIESRALFCVMQRRRNIWDMGTCHHQVLKNFLPPPSIFHLTSFKIYHNYILIFLSPPILDLPAPLNSVEYLGRKDETEDFVGLLVVGWVCLQIHVRAHSILQFHILSTLFATLQSSSK